MLEIMASPLEKFCTVTFLVLLGQLLLFTVNVQCFSELTIKIILNETGALLTWSR